MSDTFRQIHDQLFANGCCKTETWIPVVVFNGEQNIKLDALKPNRGCIQIRIRKSKIKLLEDVYVRDVYEYYRFDKKGDKLIYLGYEKISQTP